MRFTICLAILLAATASPTSADTLELPERLDQLLTTGRWDATPAGFRIITLSQLADGCAGQGIAHPARRENAHRCIERTLALALKSMPAKSLGAVQDALWLSHLNLMYGAADQLGSCESPSIHRQLSERLAAMSLADKHAHAASYASVSVRWPADQSATLASLARYDRAHHAHVHDRPVTAWQAMLGADDALPPSEITGAFATSKYPRGCANAFLTRCTTEFAPSLGRVWWTTFRDTWSTHVGPFTGLREWPPGVERPGDVDSGPIIMGIGTAASALSIAAARAQGDEAFALALETSAAQVMALGVAGGVPTLLLADAISFEGHWQQRPEGWATLERP